MRNLIILILLAGVAFAGFNAWKASQAESKEARTVKSLPPSVQHTVAQMDTASQNAFFNEYERKKKKVSIGYVAWMVCGWHYFYVKKTGLQVVYYLTAGGFGLWAIADLFRMPSIIRDSNESAAREALQTLAIGNQFNKPSGGTPPPSVV